MLILPKAKQLLQWRCRKEYKIGIHYQRSVEGLSPAESEASHILSEFADVFSKGPHDLGGTNLLKHCIDTWDAAPIWQLLRRLPLTKCEETERIGKEMHENRVMKRLGLQGVEPKFLYTLLICKPLVPDSPLISLSQMGCGVTLEQYKVQLKHHWKCWCWADKRSGSLIEWGASSRYDKSLNSIVHCFLWIHITLTTAYDINPMYLSSAYVQVIPVCTRNRFAICSLVACYSDEFDS